MAFSVRIMDTTNHGGTVMGPGAPTVLVGGMPAAVATDTHVCAIPPNTPHPTVSTFPMGSTTVLFEGKPALRTTDAAICGAMAVIGEPTVQIG